MAVRSVLKVAYSPVLSKVRQPSPVRVPNPLASRAEYQEKQISEDPINRKFGLDSKENIQPSCSYSRISQRVLEGFQKDFDDLFPTKQTGYLRPDKSSFLQKSNHCQNDFIEHSRAQPLKTQNQPHVSPTILANRTSLYLNMLNTPVKANCEPINPIYPSKKALADAKLSIEQPSSIGSISRAIQAPRAWKFDQQLEASPVAVLNEKKKTKIVEPTVEAPVQRAADTVKPVIPKLNLRAVSEDLHQHGMTTTPVQLKSQISTLATQQLKSDTRTSPRCTLGSLNSGGQMNEACKTQNTNPPESDVIREAAEESKAMLARLKMERSQQKTPDSEDSRHSESLQQKYPAPRSRDSGGVGLQQYNTFRPMKYETVESENSQPTTKPVATADWRPPQVPGLQKSHTFVQISSSNANLPNYVSFARDAESLGSVNYRTADFNLSDNMETSQPDRDSSANLRGERRTSPEKLDSFMMEPEEKIFKTDVLFEETTSKLQELKNLCLGDLIGDLQTDRNAEPDDKLNRVININLTPRSPHSKDEEEPSFAFVESPAEVFSETKNMYGALDALSTLQKKLEGLPRMDATKADLDKAVDPAAKAVEEELPNTTTSREDAYDLMHQGVSASQRGTKTSVTGDVPTKREDFAEGDLDLNSIRKQLEELLQDSIALEYSDNNTALLDEDKKSQNPNLTAENFDVSRNFTPRTAILPDYLTDEKLPLSLRKGYLQIDSTRRTENPTPLGSERAKQPDTLTVLENKVTSVVAQDQQATTKSTPVSGRSPSKPMQDGPSKSGRGDNDENNPSVAERPKYSEIIDRFMRDIIHSTDVDRLNSPRYL